MRNRERCRVLVTAGLALAVTPCSAWAGGTPHLVWGAVRYLNGSVPQGFPELQGVSTLSSCPAESVLANITYDPGGPECYADFQCASFSQWGPGDTLHIYLWADGTSNVPSHAPEHNDLEVVLLDTVGSQYWGIFYLPVELTSFTAEGKPGCAVLSWATATETDNLGFWLWRSAEGGEYARVNGTLIKGAGTSAQPHNYVYADEGLSAGTYWYKLQDVAANGATQSHGPIGVTVLPAAVGLRCAPHPVRDLAVVSFELVERAPVSVRIYDLSGSLITALAEGILEPGDHVLSWGTEDAPAGLYHCRLEMSGSARTCKVVVLK